MNELLALKAVLIATAFTSAISTGASIWFARYSRKSCAEIVKSSTEAATSIAASVERLEGLRRG